MSTPQNQFFCTFEGCTKVFKARKSLVEHMRIHNGERPYQCRFPGCEKSFTQYSSMQKHERTHTGIKPYKCNVCEREFTQISNLKRHERVHTGDKPHECEFCSKKFSTISNLKQHLHIHEKEDIREKFYCALCQRMYLYRSSLRKHIQEHEAGVVFSMNDHSTIEETATNNEDIFDLKIEPEDFQSIFEDDKIIIKEDPYFEEESMKGPDPSKFVFVEEDWKLKPSTFDYKNDLVPTLPQVPTYYQEGPTPNVFDKPKFNKFSNFDLFPSSPTNYKPVEPENESKLLPFSDNESKILSFPENESKLLPFPENESKILPLTSLLGSPLRDRPSRNYNNNNNYFDFQYAPIRTQISNSVVYYKGEMYYLYDRTLNRYKTNGELVIRQMDNDDNNPSVSNRLSEISHYPTYDSLMNAYKEVASRYSNCLTLEMLMSGKNCNSLVCSCSTGAASCTQCACGSEGHKHNEHGAYDSIDDQEAPVQGLSDVADDECPLDNDFCAKLRDLKISPNDHICLCEVTKGFRHVHGPNCGHPAIMHDGHVDYIVDGILHHFDGEHCNNHGPICLIEKASEEYAMGLISSGMLPECKI